jgi:hypothetical protein
MNQAANTPPHIESLARKLEAWVATDLVDSERDALRAILIAAANGTDEVNGFLFGLGFGEIVVQASETDTIKQLAQTTKGSADNIPR